MNKAFHKLISVSLAAMLMLSVISASAFAADHLSMPDDSTSRTLTIYKYATVETATDTATQNVNVSSSGGNSSSLKNPSDGKNTVMEEAAGEGSTVKNSAAVNSSETTTATVNSTETQSAVVGSEYRPVSNAVFDIYRFASLGDDCPESIAAETAYAWIKTNSGSLSTSVVTDANGCAVWHMASDQSKDGIYLVVERLNSAVVSTGIVAPFLVSVPSSNLTATAWEYNVVVQPKNLVLDPPSIEKDVVKLDSQEGGVNIGEKFSWIIRSDIPADLYSCETVNGQTIETYAKNYTVSDTLDSRLDFRGGIKVEVAEKEKVILTLSENDYTLTSTVKENTAGGRFSIALKGDGMKHIMQAVTDVDSAELRITFDTSINSTANPGENVYNNATLDYTNSFDFQFDPIAVVADNVPFVYTGGFKILKVDINDTAKKLSGAEFHIAASETDAKNKNWLKDAEGNEIVLTTDQNGTAAYRGLAYDKNSTTPAGGTYYWLVETKAPVGYSVLADPVKITVDTNSYKDTTSPVMIKDGTAAVAKDAMPLTGNATVSHWWIIAIVLVCVAGTSGLAAFKLRKKSEK